MTKYLRIYNEADNVSRIALEKLGLSTKRDNPDTIGRFGSGIKFAPIFALRNGWEWVFTGTDNLGDYKMSYVVQKEHGIDCIWYDYGDVKNPSSFTLDAGGLSWTDTFQIYREAVSNAMDGAKEYGGEWGVEIVDSVKMTDGYFNVYITAAPELVEIYNNHDKYFCTNRKKVDSKSGSSILEKIDGMVRIYSHDVLVYTHEASPSMFDYCFDGIELNEERTVKSTYAMRGLIENSIVYCKSRDVISKVVDCASKPIDYFEFDSGAFKYVSHDYVSPLWLELFYDRYGENAVILDESMRRMNLDHMIRLNGATPVHIHTEAAYTLLKGVGVSTAIDKLGESVQYDIDDDISKYPRLKSAISIARIAEPGLELYIDQLSVFSSPEESIMGLTINMDKNPSDRRILVAKHHARDASVNEIIATILHEYDHATTGYTDGYDSNGRSFREVADRRIGKLVYENYRECPLEIHENMVISRSENLEQIGFPLKYSYEYSDLLNSFIVKTSRMNFIIESDHYAASSHDVRMDISEDGEYFVLSEINDPKGVKIA